MREKLTDNLFAAQPLPPGVCVLTHGSAIPTYGARKAARSIAQLLRRNSKQECPAYRALLPGVHKTILRIARAVCGRQIFQTIYLLFSFSIMNIFGLLRKSLRLASAGLMSAVWQLPESRSGHRSASL
jgi:hypothetical protein